MGSKYFLHIESDYTDGDVLAHSFGDLDEISYLAKRRIKELTGSSDRVSVKLVEVDSFGDAASGKREVTSFTGDADTAAVVLKRKLAAERAEQQTPYYGPEAEAVIADESV